MDQHLYTTEGPPPNTVLWRPPEGGSVVLKERHYQPFSQVVRTLHIPDAIDICAKNMIAPKPIYSISTLKPKMLHWQRSHPCRYLHILWFGAKLDGENEDAHEWYGNVEFAIPIDVMLQRWKNLYFVEMVQAPTQTITRILVTNTDYSSVLPSYDPRTPGGPWRLTPDGRHERLVDCRRYNSKGYNRHGHTLEFMIEVTPFGMRKILDEVTISFRNHHQALSGGPHVCHRFGKTRTCPTPFIKDKSSHLFFEEHHRLIGRQPMATTPRLSPSAEVFLQRFLAAEEIPRNVLQVQVPPPLSEHDFPPVGAPGQDSVIFCNLLQKQVLNGEVRKCQLVFGFWDENVFGIISDSIWKPDKEKEKEKVIMKLPQHRPNKMQPPPLPHAPPPGYPPLFTPQDFPHLATHSGSPPRPTPPDYPPQPPPSDLPPLSPHPGYPPFPTPQGFPPLPQPPDFPLPPPPGLPPLHLPPPPMFQPPMFLNSWASLQSIFVRRQN
ncbi:uncharacterized protein LOC126997855 isoform X1 [Eriocheir sinensis]|uniref:uncharacterized protein LOC126997855 isoform X1 n=1 Tax=Eriocheir sinensis TaxID=95602 RepID=UPI0021CAAC8E|nr:uncharacterized protein LOC126997855 isoform X1 [Eriocheir sinensis]XP_050715023.1 uncharacterized protein LOC126997855 isoform X1 [Eriocheir sinensis]